MKSINLAKLGLLSLIIVSGCATNVQIGSNDINETKVEKAAKINTDLGIEYMRRGRYDIALQKFEKALKLNKYSALTHNAIAVLYQALKVDEKAKLHYQIAIELNPTDSDILNNYGQFLCQKGNWKGAEKHFLKALENPVYQKPEIPYTNAGLCALKHHHFYQAESYFRKALQKNPKFPRALYQMAELSYKQRHYQQARDYLQRYDKIAEHTSQSLWLRVRVERSLGNKDAEASYALLLRHSFPDSEATRLLNLYETE
jgi:type IV pilus assembly protein PilF